MKTFLKNNFIVLAIYVIALAFSFSLLLNYEKTTIHIYLNGFVGNKFLNQFSYYITYLGDGLIAPFILVMFAAYNTRLGMYATISFLSATLASQVLKHYFFDDVNRPAYIFRWIYYYPIRYVDGVDPFIHNSFPSGHATQAFSILMCFVFVTGNQLGKLFVFFLALFTSLSRVYLSQHWLGDITAGSMIGLFFSILFYYIVIAKNNFERFNKPLVSFIRP